MNVRRRTSTKKIRFLLLGLAVTAITAVGLVSLDALRPTGLARLLSFAVVALTAPLYVVLSIAGGTLWLSPVLVPVASIATGTQWAVAAALFSYGPGKSRGVRATTAAAFFAGVVVLAALVFAV